MTFIQESSVSERLRSDAATGASQSPVPAPEAPTPCDCPTAGGALLLERYRQLAQVHLGRVLRLFRKLTALDVAIVWGPRWPRPWSSRDLPVSTGLCRELWRGQPDPPTCCRSCARKHLGRALKSDHSGHRFTCTLGVHNFWLPLLVRDSLVGLAFIQMPAWAGNAAARRRGPVTRSHRRMNRAAFGGVARLLRHFFRHVETAALANLLQSDLIQTRQALLELRTEAAQLRMELNGMAPAYSRNIPGLETEKHADRLVHAAMDYIHHNYSRPLTLRECATQLHLNAAYLSLRFSRAVGIPFKAYLTAVRMEKARQLLGDPIMSIAQVAYVVGYASENRFRIAFKQSTGLSPRLWRDTFRLESSPG